MLGKKNARYYFTGEKDYTPVIYRGGATTQSKVPVKRKAISPVDEEQESKKRGHNQYTPKELLVKNQPKATVSRRGRYGSPSVIQDRSRDSPFHQEPPRRIEGMFSATKPSDFITGNQSPATPEEEEEEDLWMEIEDPKERRKSKRENQYQLLDPTILPDTSSDMEDFPFLRSKAATDAKAGGLGEKDNTQPTDDGIPEHGLEIDGADEGHEIADSGSYAFKLEQEIAQLRKAMAEKEDQIKSMREVKDEAKETAEE